MLEYPSTAACNPKISPYEPTTPADWTSSPNTVQKALDEVGGRAAGASSGSQRVTFVDKTAGDDATGVVGRTDKPFSEIKAAYDACVAAGGTWLIHIRASSSEYTSTGMAFGDATATVSYYYDAGAVHRITGSGDAYTLDAASVGKNCYILGHATVWANGSTTGKWIDVGSWVAQNRIHFEADSVNNKDSYDGSASRTQPIVYIQASPVEPSVINFRVLDSYGNVNSYFRMGGNYVYCIGNDWRGVDWDCSCVHLVDIMFATRWVIGKNGFAVGQYRIRGLRMPKGTASPALDIRVGIVMMFGGEAEMSDATAPIFNINANADTGASSVILYLQGVRMRVWGDINGTSIPIYFASVHSNFRVTLDNCTIQQENTSGGTYAISAVGAQTIEVIGTLTTTLPLGPNITMKAGTGTLVTSSGLWTGY